MIRSFIAIIVTMLVIQASHASTDAVMPAASPLQKVGEAKLRVLFWDIYYSRLYTESGNYQRGDRPLKLEIQYLLDIKSDALVERTRTEWEDQSSKRTTRGPAARGQPEDQQQEDD